MIKKLFLLTIIFLGIFQIWNVFADTEATQKEYQNSAKEYNKLKTQYNNRIEEFDKQIKRLENEWNTQSTDYLKKEKKSYIDAESKKLETAKSTMNTNLEAFNEERNKECEDSKNCIDKDTFMFNTGSGFWIWPSFGWKSTSEWVNNVFGTVIQKLMVALWALSVLIMTVWGWYIILYHGQDELLSKGKSIFMSGVIALIVALSSYMIVGLLRFILYNT